MDLSDSSEDCDIKITKMVDKMVEPPVDSDLTLFDKFDEIKNSLDKLIVAVSDKTAQINEHANIIASHKTVLDMHSIHIMNTMTRMASLENNFNIHSTKIDSSVDIIKQKLDFNNTVHDFNKERMKFLENRIKDLEDNKREDNKREKSKYYERHENFDKSDKSEKTKYIRPVPYPSKSTVTSSSKLPQDRPILQHSTMFLPMKNKIIEHNDSKEFDKYEKKESKFSPFSMSILGALLGANDKIDSEDKDSKKNDTLNNNEDENYDGNAEVYIDEKGELTAEEIKELDDIGKINNIDDMIRIGTELKDKDSKKVDQFYIVDGKKYSINTNIIVKLVQPLTRLKRLVGMSKVKNEIFDMIVYYIQEFKKTGEMLHTTIEGPPGVGKTRLGKIMAELFSAMEIIPSARFTMIKRTDLIGQYLGHTAIKTQKALDDADGGVLFLDEAYSLGDSTGKDSFAKEAIDVINQNLSENKKKLIMIVAGYQDQLEKCFFSLNAGLERRFPFRYKIEGYNEKEMTEILYDRIRHINWKLSRDLSQKFIEKFFKENKKSFTNYGGDIDTLILRCKFKHGRRVLGKHPKLKMIITKDDFMSGFQDMKDVKKKDDDSHLKMFS